jgi:hypothetical protein
MAVETGTQLVRQSLRRGHLCSRLDVNLVDLVLGWGEENSEIRDYGDYHQQA